MHLTLELKLRIEWEKMLQQNRVKIPLIIANGAYEVDTKDNLEENRRISSNTSYAQKSYGILEIR